MSAAIGAPEAHRVLLLGEDPVQIRVLEAALLELGYALAGRAASGDEALGLAESSDAHLILADVSRHGQGSGIRSAKTLQMRCGLPVLCLIPEGDQRAVNEVLACDLPGFLLKSSRGEDLRVAIDLALQKHWRGRILAGRNREEGAVAELSALLLSAGSIEEVNLLVLDKAKELTQSPVGFVGHLDPPTGHLIISTLTRDVWAACKVPGKSIVFERFSGLWGWVLREGQPLLSNDPSRDSRSEGTPPGHLPIDRFLSVPVKDGVTVMGQIALANAPRDYADEDLDIVARLAVLYALAIKRHRAEDALRESERWLMEAQRVARLGCYTYDLPSKSFVMTDVVGEIFGFADTQRLTLEQWLAMVHPDERERVLSDARKIVSEKGPLNQEYKIIRPDNGEVRWISGRGGLIFSPKGEVEKVVGTVQDITEQVNESKGVQEREMLAAIGGIASGIAHEIKNPLFAISSGIQLLMEELSLSPDQRETFEIVYKDVMRMDRLVRQLQIFSARRDLKKTRQAVTALIREAITLNRGLLADKFVGIGEAFDPDLPDLMVDRDQIHQVLINLIQNAIASSPEEGRIEVRTARSREPGGVLICVKDSGPGIPEEILERIFDPFFTTKRGSAGMGLAISRRIAKDHGGKLSAANDPRGGAVFSLELPAEVAE